MKQGINAFFWLQRDDGVCMHLNCTHIATTSITRGNRYRPIMNPFEIENVALPCLLESKKKLPYLLIAAAVMMGMVLVQPKAW